MERDLEQQFKAALAQIERDAAELGTNWTRICREVGISRSTPDRWEASVPATVHLVAKVQRHLESLRRQRDMQTDRAAS